MAVGHGHGEVWPDRVVVLAIPLPCPPPERGIVGGIIAPGPLGGRLSRCGLDRLPDHVAPGVDPANAGLAHHPLGENRRHGLSIAGFQRDQHPLAVRFEGCLMIARHHAAATQMPDQITANVDLRTIRILLETRDDVIKDALLADDVIHEGLHRVECIGDIPLERRP